MLPDGTHMYIFAYQKALEWKMLVYSMATWNILRPFSTFNGLLVYFGHLDYFAGF
jgi:hypothetical protein